MVGKSSNWDFVSHTLCSEQMLLTTCAKSIKITISFCSMKLQCGKKLQGVCSPSAHLSLTPTPRVQRSAPAARECRAGAAQPRLLPAIPSAPSQPLVLCLCHPLKSPLANTRLHWATYFKPTSNPCCFIRQEIKTFSKGSRKIPLQTKGELQSPCFSPRMSCPPTLCGSGSWRGS